MSDPDRCPVCGSEHTKYYYEGPPGPQREGDVNVAQFFCSIPHLIKWIYQKGFEIPDLSRKNHGKNQKDTIGGKNIMAENTPVTVEIISEKPYSEEVELKVIKD